MGGVPVENPGTAMEPPAPEMAQAEQAAGAGEQLSLLGDEGGGDGQ